MNMVILKNSKGQALVEYTLILLVVIAVLIAFQKVFFAPFRDSTSEYLVGAYYDCALDVGELPGSPGLDDCFQKNTGIDPSKFKSKSGASSNSNSSNSNNNASNGSNRSKSGKGNKSNLAGRNQDNNKSGSNSGSGSSANSAMGKRLGAKDFKYAPSSADQISGESVEAGGGRRDRSRTFVVGRVNNNFGSGNDRRIAAKGISGELKRKLEEQSKKEKGLALKKGSEDEANVLAKAKKFPATRKIAKQEDIIKEEPFTFGRLIRIAFIIMILMAIILFLIGQASQITKSMEK